MMLIEDSRNQGLVQLVCWEVFVSAAEASNKMVLESLDGLFCFIGSVHKWCNQLKCDILVMHEGL
jgi:hypothetical protein